MLADLSDSGMIDQLQQLEVQYAFAKTTFERQKRLWEQQIGSIQYLQAEHNSKVCKKHQPNAKIKWRKPKFLLLSMGLWIIFWQMKVRLLLEWPQ